MDIDKLLKKAEDEKISINLILKEYLHSIILDYFFRKGLFDILVFQGGTAIRFCYKGVRYSEDLDFVINGMHIGLSSQLVRKKLQNIASYVERNVPLIKKSAFKIQKESKLLSRYILISDAGTLNIKDRTRIEIGFVPAYTYKTHFLHIDYLLSPPVIIVETEKELLSDKVVAFGGRNYLKGRDIWDIYHLIHNLGVKIDGQAKTMIEKKISAYGMKKGLFVKKFRENMDILERNGENIIRTEMEKFLPAEYQIVLEKQYRNMSRKVHEFLGDIK
jgi:predicted nucleotidyltransferase component of viral defense system